MERRGRRGPRWRVGPHTVMVPSGLAPCCQLRERAPSSTAALPHIAGCPWGCVQDPGPESREGCAGVQLLWVRSWMWHPHTPALGRGGQPGHQAWGSTTLPQPPARLGEEFSIPKSRLGKACVGTSPLLSLPSPVTAQESACHIRLWEGAEQKAPRRETVSRAVAWAHRICPDHSHAAAPILLPG